MGIFATLIATGHVAIITITELARSISVIILFFIFAMGLVITAYRAKYRRSYFNSTTDGFIVGMGWANAIIVFLLYGFRI